MKSPSIKIVHFGKYYFPENGGVESVTSTLAEAAALNAYSVEVVCFGNLVKDVSEEIIEGVNVFRCPVAAIISSQPLGCRYFFTSIKRSKFADVVHLHLPNYLAMLSAFFIPKKTKLIIHWHSDVINKGLIAFLLSPIEYFCLQRADLVIATSENYANYSRPLDRFKDKVKVVPIGIEDKSIIKQSVLSEVSPSLFHLINSKKVILSVGRLVPYKGFEVLINASKEIDVNAIVLIVGTGPLEKKLSDLVKMNKLEKKVYLLGNVSDGLLNALFRSADIFCLPSINRSEAFGVVLLEAMSYSLPIVSTNIEGSGVAWVNHDGFTGFNVPVNESNKIASACNLILRNSILAKKIGMAGRKRYLEQFQENIFVERIINAYKKLI
jgi:glycosyltransferase involved in cell wall biosynthesis